MNLVAEKYADACIKQDEAYRSRKITLANRVHDEIHEHFKQLRGKGLLTELKPLLSHPNLNVKLSAATHLLICDELLAKSALKDIAEKGKGENAFSAMMTLKEWESGNLKSYLLGEQD